jgi:peptide deformylase
MKTLLNNYQLEGELLKIYTYPAKVLKQIAKPVTTFDDNLKILIKNMIYTMYKTPGIGLAAPQVGVSIRLFVSDIAFSREEYTNSEGVDDFIYSNLNPEVYINPIFTSKDGEFIYEEGFLSLPGIYEEVKRAKSVSMEYLDMFGVKQSIAAEDLKAVCLQHENDHLDGLVFIDRISLLKKNFYNKNLCKKK